MNRPTLFFVTCVAVGLLAGIGLAFAVDAGPEKVTIDVNKAKKSVKDFPHKKHQEMKELKGNCAKCHHKTKKGQRPKKCGSCHIHPKDKDPKTGAIGFKDAYHKFCLDCHKKQKDRPELKKCKNCHKK